MNLLEIFGNTDAMVLQRSLGLKELQKELSNLELKQKRIQKRLDSSSDVADKPGHYSHEYFSELKNTESEILELQAQINLVAERI